MVSPLPRSALVVEDDPFFWALFRRLLSPWFLEVVTTSSVATARALTRERPFDLYLIDLQLADDDSLELLADLKVRATAIASRCVVVTSFPVIGMGLAGVPVVEKMELASLGPHLVRILGHPECEALQVN